MTKPYPTSNWGPSAGQAPRNFDHRGNRGYTESTEGKRFCDMHFTDNLKALRQEARDFVEYEVLSKINPDWE